MGIGLALDDFGTGYSSLSSLRRFPIERVKIDRSFVGDITADPDDATLTTAILSMAHSLNLRVVAEGVETLEQAEFLSARGCHELQGFLFSPSGARRRIRPLPGEGEEGLARLGQVMVTSPVSPPGGDPSLLIRS
jgi:EAL domain-containing protein (putative c-di-GMP-specific phosphodiesterase class I)